MRYVLQRVLDLLGFSSPDRSLDTRETLALGHLTVVLLLRLVVLLGAGLRYAVHLRRYAEDHARLQAVAAVMAGFALYIAVLFLLRTYRRPSFLSERLQWCELVLDVGFVTAMYYLTGNNESDFFLFFVIPLMLPTTMDWKLKSFASLGLCSVSFLLLVLNMPAARDAIEPSSPLKNLLRVYAPRMVFMFGVWLSVNVMMEYRRLFADEQDEKRALQEMLERMQRLAEAAPEPRREDAAAAGEAGMLQIGQTLGGRYELLHVLGKGGMGEVFQARDLELDDIVALKVLSANQPTREGTMGLVTLKQEIKTARRITHPNVVRVHDLSEIAGVRFLSMEYVPGTTLRSLLDKHKVLPHGAALQIFKQLCSGLNAVHKEGIIHRDIKPENVMVLPNGMVKLMDFGVALGAKDADAGGGGFVVGSPYYMSPEQLQSGQIDPRSDIYSVGVLLFEAFTGQHPFPGARLAEVIRHHVMTVPAPPSSVRTDLSPALDKLILDCLAKDPGERPATAIAVYAALLNTGSSTVAATA